MWNHTGEGVRRCDSLSHLRVTKRAAFSNFIVVRTQQEGYTLTDFGAYNTALYVQAPRGTAEIWSSCILSEILCVLTNG